MNRSQSRGFTLVELLVVILILSILMSILLPVLFHVLNVAHEATAETLVMNVIQAAKAYELDHAVYPPGDGSGSRDLVRALSRPGPKQLPLMEIQEDMLTPEGDLINPAQKDGEPSLRIIHYRNNRGRTRGPDGVGRPGISSTRPFDVWCARSSVDPKRPDDAWAILRP
jgi:prepilin-type N-terminal cleavage/methylation domain-containing protein